MPVPYRSQIGLAAGSDFWPLPIEFRTAWDTAPDIFFFPVFLRGKILKMLSPVSPRSGRSAGHSFPSVSRPGQTAPAAPGFAGSLVVFPLHLLLSPGCGTAPVPVPASPPYVCRALSEAVRGHGYDDI